MVALVLLVCWIAAELFVAVQVAHAIGVLATVVLLIAGWPIGTWALRSQGRTAWRRFVEAVSAGRVPTHEALDGALVLIGGTMLIIPGFITDVVGIALLLPPTRSLLRPLLLRSVHTRLAVRAARYARRTRDYDVESTATDVDRRQLHS